MNNAKQNQLDSKTSIYIGELILLVMKYAKEACQCDLMYGVHCSVHQQVVNDLQELANKYTNQ